MNQQVVADAVPLHIESTAESSEPIVLRVLGFSPEAAGHQLVALLAAAMIGPGLAGVVMARRVPWVASLVMVAAAVATYSAVRGLQNLARQRRGLPRDAAIAVSVTPRRVVQASDGSRSDPVAIRDRPRDQLVGISLQQTSFLFLPRRRTLVRFHFSDGSSVHVALGGGSVEGLEASLRLAGITELDPDGTPTPPPERAARPASSVPASTGGLRWMLCVVLAVCGVASLFLGLTVGRPSDPWAGSGFSRADAEECARQAGEFVDPDVVDVRYRRTTTAHVPDADVLLVSADVQSADGATEPLLFSCTAASGRITATRLR